MELRQLQYFVKICELRSMGRASVELGVVTSALSQQITRLETELGVRLLQRSSTGVSPTAAGTAFLHQAQLTLRHATDAILAAKQARLSGHVSVGLAPTTASVLGLPLIQAMHARYPDVRLHLVESLSGHLTNMLHGRQLDLAVLFKPDTRRHLSLTPILEERLFLIALAAKATHPSGDAITLSQLRDVPLILPSANHGLRATLVDALARAGLAPNVVAEIDGLALLMDAVAAGLGATVQPGAALARHEASDLQFNLISDPHAGRRNYLASLGHNELSPAAIATRVVIEDVMHELVASQRWAGASLLEN